MNELKLNSENTHSNNLYHNTIILMSQIHEELNETTLNYALFKDKRCKEVDVFSHYVRNTMTTLFIIFN